MFRSDARVAAMIAAMRAPLLHPSINLPALNLSSLILQQILLLLRLSAATETAATPKSGCGTPGIAAFGGLACYPTLLPANSTRRYVLSALHLIRTLFVWLPPATSSPATAIKVAAAAATTVARSPDLLEKGSADWGSLLTALDEDDGSVGGAYRAVEEALCRALAIVAYECPTSATAAALGETAPQSATTFFAPILFDTQPTVSGAAPPLSLIAAISCWAVQELDDIDGAHEACAELTPRLASLPVHALRTLHGALHDPVVNNFSHVSIKGKSLHSRLLRCAPSSEACIPIS